MNDDESRNSDEGSAEHRRRHLLRVIANRNHRENDNDEDDENDGEDVSHRTPEDSHHDDHVENEEIDEQQADRARFLKWKTLVDFEDWSELFDVVERGSCRCHRSIWWKHLMRTLGYIISKPEFKNPLPQALLDHMIHKAVSMTNDEGHSVITASHSLCDDSGRTLQVLLQWFSEMLDKDGLKRLLYNTTQGQGYNAIDECWKRCMWLLSDNDLEFPHHLPVDSEPVRNALRKTMMMIDCISPNSQGMLHAILSAPCPNIAVHAAICICNRNEICTFDSNGNLPLHIAAANPVHHELVGVVTSSDPIEVLFRTHAIEMLLEHYPAAARIPNGNGRVALNLAVENYGKWEEDTRKRKSQRDCCADCIAYLVKPFEEIVEKLVEAGPEALQARDTETHLYPFLLAATNDAPLGLVYMLFRENPGVVQRGVRRTNYEIYLQDKLNKCEATQEKEKAKFQGLKRERDELLERLEEKENSGITSRKRTGRGFFGWLSST